MNRNTREILLIQLTTAPGFVMASLVSVTALNMNNFNKYEALICSQLHCYKSKLSPC